MFVELFIPHKFKIFLVLAMNGYGVESFFQIYSGHLRVWLNDFENI